MKFTYAFAALAAAATVFGATTGAQTKGGDLLSISFDLKALAKGIDVLADEVDKGENILKKDAIAIGKGLVKVIDFVADGAKDLAKGTVAFTKKEGAELVADFKKVEKKTESVVKGLVAAVEKVKIVKSIETDLTKFAKGVEVFTENFAKRLPKALEKEAEAIGALFNTTLSIGIEAYA